MTRPTIAKIEGPKSSIRRRIREGESGGPLSGDKEGGAGGRVSADGDDSSPLSAEADSFRMSHGGGGRSSAIRAPSKSAKSISDQGLPLLMSGMFAGGRLRRRNMAGILGRPFRFRVLWRRAYCWRCALTSWPFSALRSAPAALARSRYRLATTRKRSRSRSLQRTRLARSSKYAAGFDRHGGCSSYRREPNRSLSHPAPVQAAAGDGEKLAPERRRFQSTNGCELVL
jgi:hypothetical protein